jgi:hypothetical protein
MLRINTARKLKKQLTKGLCWKASIGGRERERQRERETKEEKNKENKVGVLIDGGGLIGRFCLKFFLPRRGRIAYQLCPDSCHVCYKDLQQH